MLMGVILWLGTLLIWEELQGGCTSLRLHWTEGQPAWSDHGVNRSLNAASPNTLKKKKKKKRPACWLGWSPP